MVAVSPDRTHPLPEVLPEEERNREIPCSFFPPTSSLSSEPAIGPTRQKPADGGTRDCSLWGAALLPQPQYLEEQGNREAWM